MKKLAGIAGLSIVISASVAVWARAFQTSPRAAHARAAVRRSLLDPSTLKGKAPATFKAKFSTTQGVFVVEVTRAWAPLGADRFYNLVKNGFYNDAMLFRVMPGFVVQFGINAKPAISKVWSQSTIPDDPVTQSNKRGCITFATAGPNTRTTQVFINLNDNAGLDGQGFAPFGQVVEGMGVVEKFNSQYDDQPTNMQGQIEAQGNAFLKARFPNLDTIKTAVIVPAAPSTPAKKPAGHAPSTP